LQKKRVVVSVISDLVSDQRVHKVCTFLTNQNAEVLLIGRCFDNSLPVDPRSYKTERLKCYFRKGILQYAEFNLKLFIKLFKIKAEVFLSNDLDTLLPNFIISKLRKKKLVYDSHEYFTGVPDLREKPVKRKIWQILEHLLLPRIQFAYTVNKSIADLYEKEYGIKMQVILNAPYLCEKSSELVSSNPFPEGKTILLMQGAGINNERGAEELVQSMSFLPSNYLLVFIGSGDVWTQLQNITKEQDLQEKIMFIGKIPFNRLPEFTRHAHLGFSLDKPTSLNYRYSLPNKLLDYIHAGVPVLASDVVEVKRILNNYDVGSTISEVTPENIAKAVLDIFNKKDDYLRWKSNTQNAAKSLNWQNEEKKLLQFYKPILQD
jgi:glycosyltransferase involved in cell wall biosynthesis